MTMTMTGALPAFLDCLNADGSSADRTGPTATFMARRCGSMIRESMPGRSSGPIP